MLDIINTQDSQIVVSILFDPMKPEARAQYSLDFEPGKPLSWYVLPLIEHPDLIAVVNGEKRDGESWDDIDIKPGDKVAVTGRYGATVAAWVGLAVLKWAAVGGISAFWGNIIYWTAYAVTYMAIMYSVSYLCTALLSSDPPDKGTGTDQERSPTYSWGALQPTYTEGTPIQIIFGTNKVAGQVLNQYTEIGDDGKNYLNIMLGVGYGEVDSIEDIEINGRAVSNFKEITTYTSMGDNDGEVFPNFDQIYTHHNYNMKESGSGSEIETGGNSVEKIELDVSCPYGCYYSNDKGGLNTREAVFDVYYRVKNDISWVLDSEYTIEGAQTDAIRKTITIDSLSPETYEIKILRTNEELSTHRGANDLYLVGMREIIKQELLYPGIARYAIRAMATDQLSGQRPSVTCIVSKDTVRIWDEDAGGGPAWADKDATNPAWAVWYLFNHYGEYDPTKLDWDAFSQWANDNDADIGGGVKKAVYNGVIDTEGNLWGKANDIAKYGRAQVFKKGTIVSVFVDREDATVSHVFSMGNIIEDSFILQYLPKADRANCIEITYTDPDRGYDRKIVQVKSSEYEDSTKESIKTSISFNATLPRAQVIRDAAYRLNSNKWLIRAVEFNVDVQAFACVIGDLFYFQHDVTDYANGSSGRIVSAENVSGTGFITLDHEVTLAVSASYSVLVWLSDDTIVEKALASVGVETTSATVELTTEWATIPTLYDVFMFGTTSNYKKEYRLTNVSRQDDKIMRLTGLEYLSDIYDDTTDYVIEDPIWEQREQEAAGVWLNEYLVYSKDGGYQSNIGVTWHPAYAIDPVKWDVWVKDLTAEQIDGLIGQWNFNEGTGTTAYDLSGEENDGTIEGACEWEAGALHLDGSTGYVDCGNDSTYDFTSEDFSVSFRVYCDTLSTNHRLISRGVYQADGWEILVNAGGSLLFRTYQSGVAQQTYTASATVTTGQWYDVVVTLSGQDAVIYVDTVDSNDRVGTHANPTTTNRSLLFGVYKSSVYFLDGLLDEIRIYNRVLALDEIDTIHALSPTNFTNIAETDNLHSVISASWLTVGNEYQVVVTPSGLGPINTGSNHASIKLWGKLAPPEDVTGFNASWTTPGAKTNRTIEFSWNPVADIDLSHYEIRDGSSWLAGAVVIEHATGSSDTLYVGEGINATKTYWIAAVDRSGVYSETPVSDVVTVDTSDCVVDIPTGLTLTTTSSIHSDGQDRAFLYATWDDYAGTNTDYLAYYWIRLEHMPSGHTSSYKSGENHYQWELPPNVSYGVELASLDKSGNVTSYCTQVTKTTAKDAEPPATPTWPGTLSIVPGFKCIALNWVDSTEEDFSHYEIERSMTGAFGGEQLLLGEARVSFFVDALDLDVLEQVWYRVRAKDTSDNPTTDTGWSTAKNTITTEIGELDIAYNSITANHLNSVNVSAYFGSFGTMEAGVLQSANWGVDAGQKYDLTNDVVTLGGSDNPNLYYTGSTLNINAVVTITGGSGAANLTDLGALGLADQADFATQVSGTGKPANNADVTGSNTSLNTSNVGGVSAADMAGWAAIDETKVDGGKIETDSITATQLIKTGALITATAQIDTGIIRYAHIGNAEVDTLKIAGEAVTAPASGFSGGTTSLGTSWVTMTSCAVSAQETGTPVHVVAALVDELGIIDVRITVNGGAIWTATYNMSSAVCGAVSYTPGTTASRTYALQAKKNVGSPGTTQVSQKSIIVLSVAR